MKKENEPADSLRQLLELEAKYVVRHEVLD